MQFVCKDNHFFVKTRLMVGMRRFLTALMALFIYTAASAGPARPGKILLTQPDGSKFYAVFAGDEFMKIKMTEAGEAIVQDEDGWWSYATYDFQGKKVSTGCHVGSSSVPAGCTYIPYDMLSARAFNKKRAAERARMQRMESRMMLQGENLSQKNKAGLVILAQFQRENEKFHFSKDNFVQMLTQNGYSYNGATGSAKEYFDQQFNGKYEFSFDVTDVVTVSQKRSFYGKNDSEDNDENPHIMVIEACRLADEQGVDFSKYDQDGDGEVDNVFVFFAGLDEASGASDDHIWSHAWYIKDGAGRNLVLDGVIINRYACASEREGSSYEDTPIMTGIGTFCHEYSHTLGLPDFYDTDYNDGGFAAALWSFTSLMDGGNYNNDSNTPPYFNAMEREILGLSQPIVINSSGTYELPPINQGTYYRINTSTENEYFLLEYRDGASWDKYIGGSGMLVYHIDKSQAVTYSNYFQRDITSFYRWYSQVDINTVAERQCADLIEADARMDQFTTYADNNYINLLKNVKGVFFPLSNGKATQLTPRSTPGLKCWDTKTSVSWTITNIAVKDGKASFNVIPFAGVAIPTPVNIEKEVFQDGAIVRFESSEEFSGTAKIQYLPSGGTVVKVITAEPYEPGKWAVELTGLQPTKSYELRISFLDDDVSGEEVTSSFMTKKRVSTNQPYIYFDSNVRNSDGTFKSGSKFSLKIFNITKVKDIQWRFNGLVIKPDGDLYYTLPSSGTMEAHVTLTDGSEEILIKEIRVYDK